MKHICRYISVLMVLFLATTVVGTYATWYFVDGRLPQSKTVQAGIQFLFPMPIGGLTVKDDTPLSPSTTSPKLWGAGDEDGKVTSASQGRDYLLKNYMPFEIGVENHTKDKTLVISFEITFCLAPILIEESSFAFRKYPFEDPFTVTRAGEVIGSGNIYFPYGTQTSGNVQLQKGEKAFTSSWRDYYYYTATIDPTQIDGWDVEKFLVAPSDDVETFQLSITHSQDNDTACFATIRVIATDYTGQ